MICFMLSSYLGGIDAGRHSWRFQVLGSPGNNERTVGVGKGAEDALTQ